MHTFCITVAIEYLQMVDQIYSLFFANRKYILFTTIILSIFCSLSDHRDKAPTFADNIIIVMSGKWESYYLHTYISTVRTMYLNLVDRDLKLQLLPLLRAYWIRGPCWDLRSTYIPHPQTLMNKKIKWPPKAQPTSVCMRRKFKSLTVSLSQPVPTGEWPWRHLAATGGDWCFTTYPRLACGMQCFSFSFQNYLMLSFCFIIFPRTFRISFWRDKCLTVFKIVILTISVMHCVRTVHSWWRHHRSLIS